MQADEQQVKTVEPDDVPGWRSYVEILQIVGFLALVGIAFSMAMGEASFLDTLRHLSKSVQDKIYKPLVADLFLNPWFYAIFVLVLILEQVIPAKKNQHSFGMGIRLDAVWLVFWTLFHATLLPVYAALLRFLFNEYLGFLRVDAAADWPLAVRVTIALLFGDLVFWFSHFVRHKVGFMWRFHAIHHSQRELNFFSDFRMHPFDDLFIYTINFIPILMFEQNFATIVAIVWLRQWHTRLYHSNIRTNFGPLRYILVTPQSHRIHHSIEPEHIDKNFGLTFSIWDHLFGTQYRGYDEYPDTGIEDHDFPVEQEHRSPIAVFLQLLYPFRPVPRRS